MPSKTENQERCHELESKLEEIRAQIDEILGIEDVDMDDSEDDE